MAMPHLPEDAIANILEFSWLNRVSIRVFRAIEDPDEDTDMSHVDRISFHVMGNVYKIYRYIYVPAVAEADIPDGVSYEDYKETLGLSGWEDLGRPTPTVEASYGEPPYYGFNRWFFSLYRGKETYAVFMGGDGFNREAVWLGREPQFYEDWAGQLELEAWR